MRIRAPKDGTLVTLIGDWRLYEMPLHPDRGSILWPQFKLMLDPSTPPKWRKRRAHYLVWGTDVQRWRRDGYTKWLSENDPELYAAATETMRRLYGPGWLLDPHGACLTEAELEAEREKVNESRARRLAMRAQKAAAKAQSDAARLAFILS